MRTVSTYVLAGLMAAAIVIQLKDLRQTGAWNATMLYWLHSEAVEQTNLLDALQNAPPRVFAGLDASRANIRSRWYAGLYAMATGDVHNVSELLNEHSHVQEKAYTLGVTALEGGDDELAMFWLAIAQATDGQYRPRSHMYLGRLCQRNFAQPFRQSAEWKYWCEDLVGVTPDNLIVDGQFELGTLNWSHLIPPDSSSVEIGTDDAQGVPRPSLRILGKSEAYHGGLFQRISFPPDTSLTYSLQIMAETEDDMRVDVLVWQGSGKSQAAYRLSQSTNGWKTYSVDISVGPDSSEDIIFAPVRVYGAGRVWIDDVIVAVIDEPTYTRDSPKEDVFSNPN